uniref:Uncharacterized protein n=1 Tax=Candidatus Methanophaga sp. ANME-1 ERB7 TaxID=2759913 RepID=A0A7G9Z8Z1_9EURY|nr:hypothetical protein HGIILDEE_00014 [Methanosarcinales archaeon ANME-1 ERB7]
MEKENTRLTVGLALSLAAIFGMFVPFALAQPTADSFGVEHASGYKNTTVSVPVTISNTQNGPITCIIFDVSYDNSIINVVDVKKGTITTSWKSPTYCNFDWGTRVAIAYTGRDVEAIPNGSRGFIALLKFSVVGEPGEMTDMWLNNIQLSDLSGENVGFDTAPAKNGTFTIVTNLTQTPLPSPSPTESPVEESEEEGESMAPDDTEYVIPAATPTITPSVMPATASPVSVSPSHISSPSSAPTATSTPNPPGFGAIFAITCLLAVAYLVLRRKKA